MPYAQPICKPLYKQRLAIAREIGDRHGQAVTLGNLGNTYRDFGDRQRAIAYYEQRLATTRAIGDLRREGVTLSSLGAVYADQRQFDRAIELYEQALAIAHKMGSRPTESVALNNLGSAYDSLGDAQRAISYYEQALAIERETGDRAAKPTICATLAAPTLRSVISSELSIFMSNSCNSCRRLAIAAASSMPCKVSLLRSIF